MKILIYIEYFYPHIGGVEQVFLEVGKRLIAKKNEIIVFTTDEPYQTANKIIKKKKTYLAGLLKEYDIKGIRVVRLSLPKFLKRYLFPFIGLPISFMMFGHVDLIHSANNYSVAIPSFLLAKMLQKPVTISVWEIWGSNWFSYFPPFIAFFYWLYEKITLHLPFNFFIAPSQFVYHQLPFIPLHKKNLSYLSGKDLRFNKKGRFRLRRKFHLDGKFVYLYYGRIGISKGVKYLITAFEQIASQFPNILLVFFSPDGQNGIFHKNLPEFLKRNIIINPSIPEKELSAHLSIADCVVVPDVSASFGLSALEVSQMGLPLIVARSGALPEVVFGKVIFATPASSQSLANAMIDAYKGKFKTIPKKHFSWEKTTRKYNSVFRKLIKHSSSS